MEKETKIEQLNTEQELHLSDRLKVSHVAKL